MYLVAIFIAAFLLRLINLNQSLWLDEAVVAKVVKTIPFWLIPTQFSPGDFHPPLYYLFMSAWSTFFGTSEIALRMPSVLFSLITGWFVYRIGCLLKNKTIGVLSAIFFLFNPLIVYYSQEARMYMMAVLFLTVALFYFIRSFNNTVIFGLGPRIQNKAIDEKNNRTIDLVMFNMFLGLAFLTFYGSIFFIGTLIIVGLFVTRMKIGIQDKKWIPAFARMTHVMVGLALAGVLLFPLLFQQLQTAHIGLNSVKNWSLVLGKAEFKNVFMVFIKFTSGRLSWYPKIGYYAVAGIWIMIVSTAAYFGLRKNKLLALLFFLPLMLGLVVSFWSPMMQYFRFIYLIVPLSILIALGTEKTKMHTKTVLIAGFVLFSLIYLTFPQFHREDWRQLTTHLNSRTPVYMILPSSDPLVYYRTDISLFELRDVQTAQVPETIHVIPYVSDIYGFNYAEALTKKGCIKTDTSSFRGPVILEKWKCLRNA